VILAADAWSQITARRGSLAWRAAMMGVLLVLGAVLAPSTYGPATRVLWLVILVIIASVALVLVRMPPRLLVVVLIGLVVVDGVREIYDYRLLGRVSPWRAGPAEAAPYRARDVYVHELPALLRQTPSTRPARVAPYASLAAAPTGSDPDAEGWIADGYHLIDYGGTVESALWRVEHNPAWLALMLEPWHGYTFPCSSVGCTSSTVHLPDARSWRPSSGVHTLSYGTGEIVYSVNISRPELIVENELAIAGWHASSSKVHSVAAGIPLRTWRLAAGRYTFTARFQEPGRPAQEAAVVAALLFWLLGMVALRRRPKVSGEVAG
jgi:hypothetical protein